MRVLHLMPAKPFGGLQRMALDLARAQGQVGLEAVVLGIYRSDAARALALKWGVDYRETRGDTSTLQIVFELRSLLASSRHDILHLHDGLLWSTCTACSLRSRHPLVVHLHSFPARKGLKRQLHNHLLAARGTRFVAVSRAVARAWEIAFPGLRSRLSVVHNGICLPENEHRTNQPTSHPRYGTATRLHRSKGVFEFVAAADAISKLVPDAKFVVAGDGPDKPEMMSEVQRRGLASRFSFLGHIGEIESFWRDEVDVALFTSPGEPFGLRLIEPLAAGVPVVAFQNGSGSDEIIDRCRGIMGVPWGDYDGFARLAAEIATDSRERERKVTDGLVDLRRYFSRDRMEREIRRLYGELGR